MKKLLLFFSILSFLLIACSGSDVYRGAWKATDAQGGKFELVFDAKLFSVTDSTGKKDEFKYSQNSVNINNGVSSYGIQLSDGRKYEILFPIPSNPKVALLKDENNVPVFAISRDEYMKYEELYNLK